MPKIEQEETGKHSERNGRKAPGLKLSPLAYSHDGRAALHCYDDHKPFFFRKMALLYNAFAAGVKEVKGERELHGLMVGVLLDTASEVLQVLNT